MIPGSVLALLEGSFSHTAILITCEVLLKLWDVRKGIKTFEITSPSSASLELLVGGPPGTVLYGEVHRAQWAVASGGGPTGQFPKGFRESFRASLDDMFSTTKNSGMPEMFLNLKESGTIT